MTLLTWKLTSTDVDSTKKLGELLGLELMGGEVIELISDLGGGKTTFTQGLVKGLGSTDNASSPTFTLSKVYKGRGGLEIHHFDFYRLSEPGIIADQLAESVSDKKIVTVVEWSEIVKDVLPKARITIEFQPTRNNPDERQISITYSENLVDLIRGAQTQWEEIEP